MSQFTRTGKVVSWEAVKYRFDLPKNKDIMEHANTKSDESNARLLSFSESETRKQVKALRSGNLSMRMSEIANKVGISRQRVYQILKKEGLPTRRKQGDIPARYHIINYRYKCIVCGTAGTKQFCSDECKRKWTEIPVICSRCGKLFVRKKRQLLSNYQRHNGLLFCGRKCASKWLVDHYGFNIYPDHRHGRKSFQQS